MDKIWIGDFFSRVLLGLKFEDWIWDNELGDLLDLLLIENFMINVKPKGSKMINSKVSAFSYMNDYSLLPDSITSVD